MKIRIGKVSRKRGTRAERQAEPGKQYGQLDLQHRKKTKDRRFEAKSLEKLQEKFQENTQRTTAQAETSPEAESEIYPPCN
ncbi:MAG: hypothetical protein LBR80_03360 [Deltaproteobacteria bacterium]|nr:hypothetical protein [Deltaproteobacteria bacterium]